MSKKFTREEALNLLQQYNKEAFHIQHSLTVGGVMEYFANELGYADEADHWTIVGLLHDLDFEMYPDQHCVKVVELLEKEGADEGLIRSIVSHGYGICTDIKPEHEMEKILYATDELTGLIGAAALMRPSKSVQDMELKSIKKKFKDKAFAQGCSRDIIQNGAEMLGWSLDELLQKTLDAMKAIPDIVN